MRFAFGAVWIVLGAWTLVRGDYAPVWAPGPDVLDGALPYATAALAIACGLGLMWKPVWSARVLGGALVVWLAAVRVPDIVRAPESFVAWDSVAELVGVLAGVVAFEWNRMARSLTALALVSFGAAHFVFTELTASMVPAYMPVPEVIAYATGVTFWLAAAGVAIGIRAVGWLAAAQLAGFAALVWVPIVIRDGTAEQFGELAISVALAVATGVVTSTTPK